MRYYTPEEDAFLLETMGQLTTAEQAEALGRSTESVSQRRTRLGLHAPRPEYHASRRGTNAEAIWAIAQQGQVKGLSYGQMVAEMEE